MIKCQYCGKRNHNDYDLCSKCGTSRESSRLIAECVDVPTIILGLLALAVLIAWFFN